MNVNDPIVQMAFRALNRVRNLKGHPRVNDKVFDNEMLDFYSEFLTECDPAQRKQIEQHDREARRLYRLLDED